MTGEATAGLDLDAISARAAAVTIGSWFWEGYRDLFGKLTGRCDVTTTFGKDVAEGLTQADAEFIAHARSDIPALLAEVRRLRAAVARVEALLVPPPTNSDDQCVNCGDRRLRHVGQSEGGECRLCGFCDGFKQRQPDVSRDRVLAALSEPTS